MGEVIRPAVFLRSGRLVRPNMQRGKSLRASDAKFVALALAIAALAWILALAGAAFAMRTMFLLCLTLLAVRRRRIPVQARRR